MKIVQVGQVDSSRAPSLSLGRSSSRAAFVGVRALRSCVFYYRAFKSRLVASLYFRPFDFNRVRFSSRTCFPALGALACPVHNPPPNKEYLFKELDLILVIIRQKTDDDLHYIILVDKGETLTNTFMVGEWAESISEMLDETFYTTNN